MPLRVRLCVGDAGDGMSPELRLCSGRRYHFVGAARPVACAHDQAMLVTVLLPG